MTITRDNLLIMLTDEEITAAYEIKDKKQKMEDLEAILENLLGDKLLPMSIQAKEKFMKNAYTTYCNYFGKDHVLIAASNVLYNVAMKKAV